MAKRSWKPGSELPVVGDVLRVRSQRPWQKFDLYEVRGIVDGVFVLREWWRTKQRWNYSCHSEADFKYGIFSVDWEAKAKECSP